MTLRRRPLTVDFNGPEATFEPVAFLLKYYNNILYSIYYRERIYFLYIFYSMYLCYYDINNIPTVLYYTYIHMHNLT